MSPFRVCFEGDIPSADPLTALSTGLASPLLPVADDVLSLLALAVVLLPSLFMPSGLLHGTLLAIDAFS